MQLQTRKQLMEIVSLPFSRLMEMPLTMLSSLNKWFTKIFEWSTDNSFIDWMNILRKDKPLVFWLSGIIWIPLMVIVLFYGGSLFVSACFIAVISTIVLSIVFAILCKIVYVILLITPK